MAENIISYRDLDWLGRSVHNVLIKKPVNEVEAKLKEKVEDFEKQALGAIGKGDLAEAGRLREYTVNERFGLYLFNIWRRNRHHLDRKYFGGSN